VAQNNAFREKNLERELDRIKEEIGVQNRLEHGIPTTFTERQGARKEDISNLTRSRTDPTRLPVMGAPTQDEVARLNESYGPYESANFLQRMMLSIPSTRKQLEDSLRQTFGDEHVRVGSDGSLIFQEEASKPWKSLDENAVTFRDIADMTGEMPEVIGQLLSATTMLTPLGVSPLARVTAAGFGTMLGNLYRQKALPEFLERYALDGGINLAEADNLPSELIQSFTSGALWMGAGLGVTSIGNRVSSPIVDWINSKMPETLKHLVDVDYAPSIQQSGKDLEKLWAGWVKGGKRVVPRKPNPAEQELINRGQLKADDYMFTHYKDLPIEDAIMHRSTKILRRDVSYNVMRPLPGEVSSGGVLRMMENVGKASPFGRPFFDLLHNTRETVMRDRFLDQFDRTAALIDPDELGGMFIDAVNNGFEAAEIPAIAIRKHIIRKATKRKGGSMMADITSLHRYAKSQTRFGLAAGQFGEAETKAVENAGRYLSFTEAQTKLMRSKPHLFNKETDPVLLKESLERVLGAVRKEQTKKRLIPFKQLVELRSRIIAVQGELHRQGSHIPKTHVLAVMKKNLDGVMETTLKKQAPDLFKLYEEQNKIFRANRVKFRNEILNRLVKKGDPELGGEPTDLLNSVFKKGGIQRARAVKEAVTPEIWLNLKRYLMNDIFESSTSKEGELIGQTLLNNIDGTGKYGKEILREVLGERGRQQMIQFSKIVMEMVPKAAEGPGALSISLTSPRAVRGMIAGQITPLNFLTAFGPQWYSRVSTSEWGRTLLLKTTRKILFDQKFTPEIIAVSGRRAEKKTSKKVGNMLGQIDSYVTEGAKRDSDNGGAEFSEFNTDVLSK
jgi:hypothetical protein